MPEEALSGNVDSDGNPMEMHEWKDAKGCNIWLSPNIRPDVEKWCSCGFYRVARLRKNMEGK